MRNSQLDATTEQKCRPGPWMRTTLHVVYGARTKQTLASTIVTKVPAWIRQWAAELLKKQIGLHYRPRLTETLWSQALVVPHHTPAWILDTWRTADTHTSIPHTHMFITPVDFCKDSTRTQLGLGLHTELHCPCIDSVYGYTHLIIHVHVTEVVGQRRTSCHTP